MAHSWLWKALCPHTLLPSLLPHARSRHRAGIQHRNLKERCQALPSKVGMPMREEFGKNLPELLLSESALPKDYLKNTLVLISRQSHLDNGERVPKTCPRLQRLRIKTAQITRLETPRAGISVALDRKDTWVWNRFPFTSRSCSESLGAAVTPAARCPPGALPPRPSGHSQHWHGETSASALGKLSGGSHRHHKGGQTPGGYKDYACPGKEEGLSSEAEGVTPAVTFI